MVDAVVRYGYKPNKDGFIICPFHKEKTASMRIYNKSFYCYGCGKGGDIFNFVQGLFNIKPYEALQRIQSDFGISEYKRLSLVEKQALIRRKEAERDKKASKEWFDNAKNILIDYYRLCWQGKQNYNHPNFESSCIWFDEAEYLLDFININPSEFYRINRIWIYKIEARVNLLNLNEEVIN